MVHFLNFSDLSAADCRQLVARALAIKAEVKGGVRRSRLANRSLLMLFEKPSTRTRASFIAAMAQGGGTAAELPMESLQISRGETAADTARVLSAYSDAIVIRANKHSTIAEFASYAACPVINGLSDVSHPCQVLADLMTYQEIRGDIAGKKVAWIGDCNNVLYSWAEAAVLFGFELRVACPPAYRRSLPAVEFYDTPDKAADAADVVMTDVWVSMGDKHADERRAAFADYCVSQAVMAAAQPNALFMHCLPAHRGEEVEAAVIDGAQSVVWQQAENRLHAQKALLLYLLAIDD